MGITCLNETRFFAFAKNSSNRGYYGNGNRDPHGSDTEALYVTPAPPALKTNAFVQGAPYSFVSHPSRSQDHFYIIQSSLVEIVLSTQGIGILPTLRGFITPSRDNRYVIFNPQFICGHPEKPFSFKIYQDKVKGFESGEILAQLSTLKYPTTGTIYPNILTASLAISEYTLGDILPSSFVESICKWGNISLLVGSDEHPTIPSITLFDLLSGPNLDTITNQQSLIKYISLVLAVKYIDSTPHTPSAETDIKIARARDFSFSLSPDRAVLIWAGAVPRFDLTEAKRLGNLFSPIINTKIIIAANSLSNFSPSSSFLDLNPDLFSSSETDHLDLVEGTVRVANYIGNSCTRSERGYKNIRTYVVASLRTYQLPPNDVDFTFFPPINFISDLEGVIPRHGNGPDDISVNQDIIMVRVQRKRVAALCFLLAATRSVKSFERVNQTINTRWATLSVCPSGTEVGELQKILKLEHVYTTSFKDLITPSTSNLVVSIRCQGPKVYSRDSPGHLTVVSAFRNSRKEAPLSIYPTSDFFIKVSLQNEDSIKDLMSYLKKANYSITPPLFHSIRSGGISTKFLERKTAKQTFHPTPLNAQTRCPPADFATPRGHFILLSNLPLLSNIDPWLSSLKAQGLTLLNTHLVRDSEYEHKVVLHVQDDPHVAPHTYFSESMTINGVLVDVLYSTNIDNLLVVDTVDRNQVLLAFNSFSQTGKGSDPMVKTFVNSTVRNPKPSPPSSSSSSSSPSPSPSTPPSTTHNRGSEKKVAKGKSPHPAPAHSPHSHNPSFPSPVSQLPSILSQPTQNSHAHKTPPTTSLKNPPNPLPVVTPVSANQPLEEGWLVVVCSPHDTPPSKNPLKRALQTQATTKKIPVSQKRVTDFFPPPNAPSEHSFTVSTSNAFLALSDSDDEEVGVETVSPPKKHKETTPLLLSYTPLLLGYTPENDPPLTNTVLVDDTPQTLPALPYTLGSHLSPFPG